MHCSYFEIFTHACIIHLYVLKMEFLTIVNHSIRRKPPTCQWLVTGRWFCQGTPVSSTNKTDRHVMKVALNTINQSIIVYKFWSLRTTNSGTFIGTNMNLHITYMLNSFLLIYIIEFPLLGLKKILVAVYVKSWTPKHWDHMELYITSLYLISQWHFLIQLHFHSWFVCMQRDFLIFYP